MAAEVNARHNKHPTIAFTLPISCQVCLGKVKNPVLCPNSHVFCSTCMDVWLQKNKQCPACRVSMTSSRKIMGGLSQQEEDTDKMTNPDLRKARFDLLYKEYENEFERMQSEIQLLKTENQILNKQVRRDGSSDSRSGGEAHRAADTSGLLVLTKKLQDATKLYEKVKGELSQLKRENSNLKDENVGLNRENQHLRQELTGRSPHRFGRTTVATLETKLASAEKDVSRLTKALERSDKYIEELEKELDELKGTPQSSSSKGYNSVSDKGDKYLTNGDVGSKKAASDSKVSSFGSYRSETDNPSRRQLFSGDKGDKSSSGERSKYYYDRNSDVKENNPREDYLDYNHNNKSSGKSQSAKDYGSNGNGKKRVTFDLEKNTNSTISFDLEMPSPLKTSGNRNMLNSNGRASPVKGVLKKSGKESSGDKSTDNYSTDLSKTLDDSLSSSYNGRSSDKYSKDDDLVYMKSGSRERKYDDDLYSSTRKKYSADDSVLSEPREFDTKRNRVYSSKSLSDFDSRTRDLDLMKSDLESRSSRGRVDDLERADLDDTQYIESELDDLNISLTPEFTDCMKLLNRAEKKVHSRDPESDDDVASKYKSDKDNDMDAVLRASTGSIGYRNGSGGGEGLLSGYKTDTNNFSSSLDTYSRGRHVRSGSLDNLLVDHQSKTEYDRPSSALPSTSNKYIPGSQNRYTGGLTTGRTTLTRTPSLDNLLMPRQASSYQNKYSTAEDPAGFKTRMSLPGYNGQRQYGETDKIDVNKGVGDVVGSGAQPVTAMHNIMGIQSGNGRDTVGGAGDDQRVSYDTVLQARARSLSGMVTSGASGESVGMDLDRNHAPSGRLTPTFSGTSGRLTPTLPSTTSDFDMKYSSSGRVTPTIPPLSDYLAAPKTSTYHYTSTSGSGRVSPLTFSTNTDYNSLSKTNSQYSNNKISGPSSLPDFSSKPPSGSRQPDIPGSTMSRMPNPSTVPYSNSTPAYLTSSSAYTNTNSGDGFSSMPTYTGASGTFDTGSKYEGRTPLPSSASSTIDGAKYGSIHNNYDYKTDHFELGASSSVTGGNRPQSYNSDDRYSASSNSVSAYNVDHNYIDGTHFSNFSSKVSSSDLPLPISSSSSTNLHVSSAFTGTSSGNLGLGTSSSYSGPGFGTSYLPTSLTSMGASMSSYTTAHSVPLTHTTSSYTSSLPSNTYMSKPLDPITESGHYSYVSNVSGDYSSKNDTFALPEPKKRLFENSDDLDISVSPIKTNRRF